MVMRIYILLLALVCACKFDERDFGDRLCVAAEDCPRPDQDCIENTCTQKSCSSDSQCGTSHDFACVSGVCVVDTCTDTDCELGYACMEGFCQASFNVTGVVSTSNTSIAITFDAAPDATTAAVLANYVVDGLTLSGTPSLSGTTVTLTTSPQTQTQYKATVEGVTRDFDKASLIVDNGMFTGRNPFRVASAVSTSAITVAVTFSEAPDPATALNIANYAVSGLTVTGTPTMMGNTVTIKTSSQNQTSYMVTVQNVRRAADAEALTTAVATFTGRNDFNIASATPTTSTTIEVAFDALPQSAAANTASNYTIAGLTVSSAVLRVADNTVVLTVSPQTGAMYMVTVANVMRASDGELLTVNNASFMGRTPFNVSDAAPKTSTSIEVTFDGPPDAAAGILSNYSIPNLTLIGTPSVAGNVVTLTTAPQNAQLYNVTVNNVKRTDGEALTDKVATFTGRDPFNVSLAVAMSTTRVDVTFDAAPNPGQAAQLTNYSIPGLTIVGAVLAGSTVVLTPSPQAGSPTYAVTVANVSRADDAELLTNATANFAGRAPFNVMNVMTPSSTSIAVVFDAPPNAAQAQTLGNYSVPGLTLTGAPVLAGSTVTIPTAPQLAQNYTLSVSNVQRSVDLESLTVNNYQFAGRPRFNVMSAASTSNVEMTVTFDGTPNETQAETLANYSVPGLTLMGTPVLTGNTVKITTSSQTGGANYTVTVANVTRFTDTEPLFTNSASFVGRNGFNVTSAKSNNTTSISVTFDALPNAGQAQTLANYSVPGLTLSGTPTLNAGTNTVTITTSPQSGGQYTVSVANVTRNNDSSPLVINSAQFTYVSFNVASATAVTNRSIAVTFDAPPTPAQATNLANYSVPGLTLTGTPTLAGSTVTIQTSSQLVQTYTATVTNVTRASDGSTLANASANFLGRLAFSATSVVSQTSGSIQVTYSQQPNATQATTLTNYSVVGLTLMGTPTLSGNTVTIQTAIQTATNYTLTINNVTRAGDAEPLFPNMYAFTGKAQTTPTITAVSIQATLPDNGSTFYNTGKATLVITGTEFTGVQCAGVTLDDRNGAGVQINTPAETCTVNTATQITATFPAGIRTNSTTGWSVRVTNGVGTGISAAKVVVKAGLLISEVMIGINGGGNNTREFFELYNPTANSINVSNVGLVIHFRNGTTDVTVPMSVVSGRRTIASHGFMLFTTTQSSADSWWNNRDQTYDGSMYELDGNGSLYLSLSTNPQVMVLDKLGWGSQAAEGREGTATANISPSQSVQRKPAGGGGAATDTDNNLTDFNVQSATLTPKGTQQAAEP